MQPSRRSKRIASIEDALVNDTRPIPPPKKKKFTLRRALERAEARIKLKLDLDLAKKIQQKEQEQERETEKAKESLDIHAQVVNAWIAWKRAEEIANEQAEKRRHIFMKEDAAARAAYRSIVCSQVARNQFDAMQDDRYEKFMSSARCREARMVEDAKKKWELLKISTCALKADARM